MESEEMITIQSELCRIPPDEQNFPPPPLFFRDIDKRAHVLWVSRSEATKTASRPSELLHSGSDDLR